MADTKVIKFDINDPDAPEMPIGGMLVEYEEGTDPLKGIVLYGFDEVGIFNTGIKKRAYAYLV